MKSHDDANAVKKAKNVAAVAYLLVLTFLVGGSYYHQQNESVDSVNTSVGR